jgi:hypothetical protein
MSERYSPVHEFSPERCKMLADFIRALPHVSEDPKGFDMNHAVHNCGSPSCIAGWANSMLTEEAQKQAECWLEAIEFLIGCSKSQARRLYNGDFQRKASHLSNVMPSEAADAIEALIAENA